MTSELSRGATELDRWAELYGHPEEWVKKAQAAHMRAEKAEAERDRYRQTLESMRERVMTFGGMQRTPRGNFWISRDDVLRLIDEVLGA